SFPAFNLASLPIHSAAAAPALPIHSSPSLPSPQSMGDEAMAATVPIPISDEATVRPSGPRNMAARAQREAMVAAARSACCAGMEAWGASAAGATWILAAGPREVVDWRGHNLRAR
ncbi:unnamed protein product, partial [Urochloa humidicola]